MASASDVLRVLVQHDSVCELRRLPSENDACKAMLKSRYFRAVLNLLDCARPIDASHSRLPVCQGIDDEVLARFYNDDDDQNIDELARIPLNDKLAVIPWLCAYGYNVIGNPGPLPERFGGHESLFLVVWGLSAEHVETADGSEPSAAIGLQIFYDNVCSAALEQGRAAADGPPVLYRASSSPLTETNVSNVKSALCVVLRHDDSNELRRLREENDRLKSMLTNRYLRSVLNLLATREITMAGNGLVQGLGDVVLSRYYDSNDEVNEIELAKVPVSEKLAIIPSLCALGYSVISGTTSPLPEPIGDHLFLVIWRKDDRPEPDRATADAANLCEICCELARARGDPLPVLHPASATPL